MTAGTKTNVQYGVWQEPSDDDESGYWCMYDSIRDAVSDGSSEQEVWEFKGTCLGTYKQQTTVVKVRKKKS